MKVIKTYYKKVIEKIQQFIQFIGLKKLIIYTLSFFIIFFIVLSFFQKTTLNTYVETRPLSHTYHPFKNDDLNVASYTEVYNTYQASNISEFNTYERLPYDILSGDQNISLLDAVDSNEVLTSYQSFIDDPNFMGDF